MNRYSKALKQLKSTKIDSKIKKLEESPTNNTKGVYSLNPQGYRLGKPEPPTQFFPKDDGTYPDGVPGTDGEAVYTRPGGFWDGGKNWQSTMEYDAGQDGIGDDGKNTDGLIDADGTVKTFLPDGSRGFVLGPLTDGFVLDHTTDAYTNIGYLQKDTRQFVLLGKITGQWKSGIYSDSADVPIWGGTSTGFTAHNENFTLAMAQWMRTQILADKYYSNLPYFYSGGVPQGGIADCPTCLPGMKGGNLVGGGGDGSSLSGDGKGTGQTGKGSGDDVTTGDEHEQGDPTSSGWDPNDPPNAKDDEKDKDKKEREALEKAARKLDAENQKEVNLLNSFSDVKIADAGVLSIPAGIATWKLVSLVAAATFMTNAELRSALSNWNGVMNIGGLFGDKYAPKPKPHMVRPGLRMVKVDGRMRMQRITFGKILKRKRGIGNQKIHQVSHALLKKDFLLVIHMNHKVRCYQNLEEAKFFVRLRNHLKYLNFLKNIR